MECSWPLQVPGCPRHELSRRWSPSECWVLPVDDLLLCGGGKMAKSILRSLFSKLSNARGTRPLFRSLDRNSREAHGSLWWVFTSVWWDPFNCFLWLVSVPLSIASLWMCRQQDIAPERKGCRWVSRRHLFPEVRSRSRSLIQYYKNDY